MLTLFKKDSLQEGVLITKHQTLVGSSAVGRLEAVKVGLMDADSFLELLDIFGSSLSEGCLRLSIALLALFGGSIDLGIEC